MGSVPGAKWALCPGEVCSVPGGGGGGGEFSRMDSALLLEECLSLWQRAEQCKNHNSYQNVIKSDHAF